MLLHVTPGRWRTGSSSGNSYCGEWGCSSFISDYGNMLLHVTPGRWRTGSSSGNSSCGEWGVFILHFGLRQYVTRCYAWMLEDGKFVRDICPGSSSWGRGLFVRQFGIQQSVITCYTRTLEDWREFVRRGCSSGRVGCQSVRTSAIRYKFLHVDAGGQRGSSSICYYMLHVDAGCRRGGGGAEFVGAGEVECSGVR